MPRLTGPLLAALLAALAPLRTAHAQDDDWSVTRRPGNNARPRPGNNARPRPAPTGNARPRPAANPRPNPVAARPAPPPGVSAPPAAGTNDAQAERRNRMITALTESVLRGAAEESGPLAVLLRLVRERDGNIDGLVSDLERRARERAGELGPHLALGHVYRESGRFDDALREYGAAERLAPNAPAPARASAALLRRLERLPEARAAYERALSHASDRAAQTDTLRQLVELALQQSDLAAARTFHGRLVALDRQSLTVRRELADALLARQQWAEAVTELNNLARSLQGDNRVLPPVLRDLGRAQAGNHQYDEALATFRRALTVAGGDAGVRRELYEGMTEVHTARNTLPEWVAELERLPGGADAFERNALLGRLHEQNGNTAAAIAAWRRASAARPADIDAHLRIAQLHHQLGQRTEEIAEYRRLVTLAPREARFVVELADLLLAQGAEAEAWRLLAQASSRAGDDPNVHERLAEVYARHGRQPDALRELQLVTRYDANSPGALTALGRQLMEMGRPEEARATWLRIYEGARDRARGAVALAEVYADNAMLPEAVQMYREALRLRPEDADLHRGLAMVLERTRSFDEAVAAWRRVLQLARADRDVRRVAREAIVRLWGLQNRLPQEEPGLRARFEASPPDLEAGRDLAEVLNRLRRPDEAIVVLSRVVELDRADVGSMVSLERALSLRGQLARALEVLARLVQADPRRAREWYQRMAQHALALHRDDEAVDFASRAVRLNDQDATAHLRLAELYRARNNMGNAIASLRRALELNDRLFASYFELAELYLGFSNDPRAAIELYRAVVRLAPDDDFVLRAGRRAIQIAPAAGLAQPVERELTSAAAQNPSRPVFRRLLVSWYEALARPLIDRVRYGTTQQATQARAQLTQLGARALAPMLDALADTDPSLQSTALDVLGFLGNPNATSALLALAENSVLSEDLRRRALAAAGPLADARALPRFEALRRQSNTSLAALANWALAHLRSPAAVQALLDTLNAGPDARLADRASPDARVLAALGLGGTEDPRARPRLRACLLDRQSPENLRVACALALGRNLDAESVPALLAALEALSSRVASAAALSLGGSLAGARSAPRGARPAAAAVTASPADPRIAALCRALFAGDGPLARSAARSLVQLAGGDVRASQLAWDDPSLVVGSAGEDLLRSLLDTRAPLETAGAVVLERFREALGEALRQALRGTAEHAGAVVAQLAEPEVLQPLLSAPLGPEQRVASAGLRALLEGATPELGGLVLHPDATVRRSAVRLLRRAGLPSARGALARAAAESDPTTAELALDALASMRAESAPTEGPLAGLLARRLSANNPWSVRVATARALALVGAPEAVAPLAEALTADPLEPVRLAAAQALAQRSEASARAALERAREQDASALVREVATTALRSASSPH